MSVIVSDMDGTLSTVETWRGVQAWIKAEHASPAARRFVLMQLPFIALARVGLYGKEAFRARWLRNQARLLRGVPEADLTAMGEWVTEHHLWPARRNAAIAAVHEAVAEARADDPAALLVLATGAYLPIVEAFGRRVGADRVVGTPLEVEDGIATGRIVGVVQTGQLKARAVLDQAGGHPVWVAFGDTAADIPMLELAGRAVAVAPDSELRRVAVDRGWELLDAD